MPAASLNITGVGNTASQPFELPDLTWSDSDTEYRQLNHGTSVFPAGIGTVPRVDSKPQTPGQQLVLQDSNGLLVFTFSCRNIPLFNQGPVQPLWQMTKTGFDERGLLPQPVYIAPFQIIPSGFQPTDTWIVTIPSVVQGPGGGHGGIWSWNPGERARYNGGIA
jgi:hypothetical protein